MAGTVPDLENKKQASDATKEERADPPFQVIKNELEEMIALFKEIVSKWDSSEARKKNDEANPLSQQSSEASKKNDEANPPSQQSPEASKKNDEANPPSQQSPEASKKNDEANPPSQQSPEATKKNDEANPPSQQSSEATKKNDETNPLALCCQWIKKKKLKALSEANPFSPQSSEASKKNDEANPLALRPRWSENKEALFDEIVSKWDSSQALRSRWIKKKLEKLKDLFEGRGSKWEDNDIDKLNRIIGDIQLIRNLVAPEMASVMESRIGMIPEAIQKKEKEEAGHPEGRSSFQRINKELEDNLLRQVSALVGHVDNLVSGPYGNDGEKLNHIIDDIQHIRNLVSPGTAPDLEYHILMMSEVLTQKMVSEAIQKKEPAHSQEGSRFQKIEKELERTIAQFDGKVSKWEEYLLGQVSALEHDVHNLVSGLDDNNDNIERKLNRIIGDLKRITKLVTPVRPINIDLEREEYQPKKETSAKKFSRKWQQLRVEDQYFENANVKNHEASFENLESLELKLCLLFLSIFPENSVIKKRPLIYWWIGEGLIKAKGDKTAEEVGEEIFVKLIAESLIIAKFDNKWNWSPVVNSCVVHPWIRHMLISFAKEAQLFVFDSTGTPCCNTSCRRACLDSNSSDKSDLIAAKLWTVFNVSERYPSFKDADWLRKLKNLVALQLGRWQDSVRHHIEMEDEILKGLGAQKHLKYLSLRGISRITELPDSIVNLISLEILDLRACHNLERLPKKIASLRKLTHLDVSECYLLESMPEGLEKLTALQVLKGFVVGDQNETSCRIGYLGKLKKLRKLSIRIGKMAVIQNEKFGKLREIESLRCLTIAWVKGIEEKELSSLPFPSDLEKLDLRGIPVKKAPKWLHPSQQKKLKKLYIRGGELDSLDSENGETDSRSWQVEILIMKYLKHLEIQFPKLLEKFSCLRYLEKIECPHNDTDIVWDESKGKLWPKEEKQRHAAGESAASSSMS